jgi:hypothetical protein
MGYNQQHEVDVFIRNRQTNKSTNQLIDKYASKQTTQQNQRCIHTNNSHSDLVVVRSLKNPKIPWVTIPLAPNSLLDAQWFALADKDRSKTIGERPSGTRPVLWVSPPVPKLEDSF